MPNTTNHHVHLNLDDPIWTIGHVAQALHVSVDRAREYTSRDEFPGARRLGISAGRLLWPREEILAWFAAQPSFTARARRRVAEPASSAAKPLKAYQPRSARSSKQAAA